MNFRINLLITLVPCLIDVAIIFHNGFLIDFRIDCCIDDVDFRSPKMDPWNNILGQGASKKHRPLPTGLDDAGRHGAENVPNTILIDAGAIVGRLW